MITTNIANQIFQEENTKIPCNSTITFSGSQSTTNTTFQIANTPTQPPGIHPIIYNTSTNYNNLTLGTTNSSKMIISTKGNSIIEIHDKNGDEIVKLNVDGTVKWDDRIKVDQAAEAFSQVLTLSAELQSGITQNVKIKMRDSVFEDLIGIAKEKGPLSAEDLTYLLQASKIVEKLKSES